MGKKKLKIEQAPFEYLKKRIIKESGIDLLFNKAYSDLSTYLINKSKENFPPTKDSSGKDIQQDELISIDSLRRYWGEKDAGKDITPDIGKLSVLTRAIGYRNWGEFLIEYNKGLDTIDLDDILPIFSNPDDTIDWRLGNSKSFGVLQKYITVKLIDDFTYEITKSVNTNIFVGERLKVKDFRVSQDTKSSLPTITLLGFYDEDEDIIL